MTEGEKEEEAKAKELMREMQGGDGEDEEEDDATYKKNNQFASHLKKNEAQSEFAKSKTLAEQRRFLPVYECRDDLLNVSG